MPAIEGTRALKTWIGTYDFAVHGGAVGTITLSSDDGPIPVGAVVMGGYVDIITAMLSATGTAALTVQSAADLLAASAQAALTVSVKSVVPAFTGATAIKMTAARSPAIVIATAAFTAGKLNLVLVYR
jgi:hypothetical protein